MSSSTDLIGIELNQTYRIDELIGKGGMGEVYRGHNVETGEPVAIKILLQEFAKDELYLGLFRKEARILHHLAHDAIVRYFVCATDRVRNLTYLAMELVDGISLAETLKQGPLSAENVARLKFRLADGMQKAHQAGVFHRDLSPDNIIMPGNNVDEAKIIDFGIARSTEVGGETLLGGSFAGKFSYVAPEQLGMFGGQISAQSDIYSLGLVLASALRGKPLDMLGSQVEVVEKRKSVPELSGVPTDFHAVLTAMLQPDPSLRPKSMAEVRDWKILPMPVGDSDRTVLLRDHVPSAVAAAPSSPVNFPTEEILTYHTPELPRKGKIGVATLLGLIGLSVIGMGVLGGLYYVEQQRENPAVAAPSSAKTEAAAPSTQKTKPIEAVEASFAREQTPAVGQLKKVEPPLQAKPIQTGNGVRVGEAAVKTPLTEMVPGEKQKSDNATIVKNEQPVLPQVERTDDPTVDVAIATKPSPTIPLPPLRPPSNAVADTPDAIVSVAAAFDGGSCFRVEPGVITAQSAKFLIYGMRKSKAEAFLEYLKPKLNFEPDIRLQMISAAQCPILDVLSGREKPDTLPLSLEADAQVIRASNLEKGKRGDPLKLKVTGIGSRALDVFLVDDAGRVQNMRLTCSDCFSRDADGNYIMSTTLNALPSRRTDGGPEQHPILLLALAGDGQVNMDTSRIVSTENAVILSLLKASYARMNASASVFYFKLENAKGDAP
jgi:serine/threonine protein kinase